MFIKLSTTNSTIKLNLNLYTVNNILYTFLLLLDAKLVVDSLQLYLRDINHPPPSPGATQPIVGVYFTALYRTLASSRTRLLDHTQRRATVGRTPLNE